jgi:transposase
MYNIYLKEACMRFYACSKQFYAGVDLHARSQYLCIMDRNRNVLVHKELRNQDTDKFLSIIAPYKHDLVVACESTYAWYWLSDLCADHGIEFILGHALYMKAIHGGKTKNDRIDSHKIALLVQSGMFPLSYVYPREQRPLRDLLRRRLSFTRHRADLLRHLQLINTQNNFPAIGMISKSQLKRAELSGRFTNEAVSRMVTADMALVDGYERIIKDLEQHILSHVRLHNTKELALLQSIRGIGDIIALTILFESGDIRRFASVGQYASYARLVVCTRESGGKLYGSSGKKIGNPYLKYVYSEAAVYAVKFNAEIEKYHARLAVNKGKGKAYVIIAHKLARAVYHMLIHGTVFDMKRFIGNDYTSQAVEPGLLTDGRNELAKPAEPTRTAAQTAHTGRSRAAASHMT